MKKATKYALLNSALMGGAVFVGAFSDGQITYIGTVAALSTALTTFFANMKQFMGNIQNKKGIISPGAFIIYGAK